MKNILLAGLATSLLQGCIVLENKPCEDILEVKRQEKMCQTLRKQMNDKSHPQAALTAKQRYEEACVDLRYYRDDYDTICHSDERPVGKQ
ncbi:hypothetical protein [Planctobacterium marinum]|uniref:hypothetical protein n=1 Tax=Planctobacterium marinum TaxID=1631968 RepID=UPI001E576550|nr:hypothetical protein [Planctobacterium marinum]MCC2604232.1 hypothetical protein [Planctobacterium marinum]